MDKSESIDRLTARVVELETLVTHLQRTLGELDEVVLEQQKHLDLQERKIVALALQLESFVGSMREERKPEEERPPHY